MLNNCSEFLLGGGRASIEPITAKWLS